MPDRPRPDHLAGLGRSDDLLGGSARPDAPPPEDGIEIWGRRIGRALAVGAAIVIVVLFIANSG